MLYFERTYYLTFATAAAATSAKDLDHPPCYCEMKEGERRKELFGPENYAITETLGENMPNTCATRMG
jgi:hypothetical protein